MIGPVWLARGGLFGVGVLLGLGLRALARSALRGWRTRQARRLIRQRLLGERP